MKITHDTEADAMFIKLNETSKFYTNQVINDDFILSMDEQGQIIGIELLNVSKHVSDPFAIEYRDITHRTSEMTK